MIKQLDMFASIAPRQMISIPRWQAENNSSQTPSAQKSFLTMSAPQLPTTSHTKALQDLTNHTAQLRTVIRTSDAANVYSLAPTFKDHKEKELAEFRAHFQNLVYETLDALLPDLRNVKEVMSLAQSVTWQVSSARDVMGEKSVELKRAAKETREVAERVRVLAGMVVGDVSELS